MGKIYDEYKVQIPNITGIVVRHTEKRVLYVLANNYDRAKGYTLPRRVVIGKICDATHMHPNDKFRELFPSRWEKEVGERARPLIKRIGLYAAVKQVCGRLGLREMLDCAFGTKKAADLLDFVMHSLLHHTNINIFASYADTMCYEMTFSSVVRNQDYFSKLFASGLDRSAIVDFKKRWAEKCAQQYKQVWLCIDGSNDDCQSHGVELAEKGHAKSGLNVPIVSFTYAVTEQGLPVTFELYRGGLVDAKGLRAVISFLKECGFEIGGVILDRGYCDSGCLRFLRENHLPYEIMIKGNSSGVVETIAKYGNKIKFNAEFLVPHTTVFAAQEKTQLFADLPGDDYITVFYDCENGTARFCAMMKSIYREMDRLHGKIKQGEQPEVEPGYTDVVGLKCAENYTILNLETGQLQKKIDEKGLYGIVCSLPLNPFEVHRHYTCRNSSETQYMLIKTQLGYGKIRIQETASAHSMFLTAFLAALIRHQLECVAKEVGRSTTDVIRELDLIEMVNVSGTYSHVHAETALQEKIFKLLGASTSLLDSVAREENNRLSGRTPTPRYRKPGPKAARRQPAESKTGSDTDTGAEKRTRQKPGPKPGFKRGERNKDGSVRKSPGPKPGSHKSDLNKDGTPRQKPGPKPGSHREKRPVAQPVIN